MSTIGKRIKSLRISRGLSMEKLAEASGVAKGNISGYESGKYYPSAQNIISIANCFGVSTDWILKGDIVKDEYRIISKDEYSLINIYRQLSEEEKSKIYEHIILIYNLTVEQRESKPYKRNTNKSN